MLPPSPQAVETLFHQVIDLEPEKRAAYLDEHCAADADLRAAVQELLDFDAKAQIAPDFLRSPAAAGRPTLREANAMPVSFGRYRLVRVRGEGGMATVYEAEQDNPRRSVALKVIRPEVVSPEIVNRFRHEAQILARLHHPGIAQVYETGMTEDGRPFFAMELILGMPLDDFARGHNLDIPARLELMARICDAVQHAHKRGVIHRDLKPTNILVDESGHPKVLDFGVAHVTATDLISTSSRTQAGQLLGTLSYMSPEQIAADPSGIDERSDVYTLGVILFELLASRLPYRLDDLAVHEIARVIQQDEPSRLGSAHALYRGDLEIIVAKALEKNKSRRYVSAADLAADIRRYLRGDAILARPASSLYRLGKFARRNQPIVAGVIGVFAALLVGTIVSLRFALRAQENARVANAFALRADENARLANERERAGTYDIYRARVAAAVAALAKHDIADAALQLNAAPEPLRDWEWRHLHARLDDSTTVLPTTAQESQFLITDPKGWRVATLTRSSLRVSDIQGNPMLETSLPPNCILQNFPPLLTRRGLRLVGAVENSRPAGSDPLDPAERTGNILGILDENGLERLQLKGPPQTAFAHTVVSPDGSRIAVCWMGSSAWVFRLYDIDSGELKATSAQDFDYTWSIAFSPDGTRLATAGEDGITRLWDTSTGKMVGQCRGHTQKVLGIAFRPDGRRLATTSADGTVRQWDPVTGREIESPYERHTGEVVSVEYAPNGLCIASAGTDRTIRVWDAVTRQDIAVLHGHTGVPHKLLFAADGRQLASLSRKHDASYLGDGTTRVWDVANHAGTSLLLGHGSYVYPVAYSPDGEWIASGSWDNTVRLWDAWTGENCAILTHSGYVRALAFSPDSAWLLSGSQARGGLDIWNVATAKHQRKLEWKQNATIRAVSITHDGALVAIGDMNGNAGILNLATGEEMHAFRTAAIAGVTTSLAFSPDGRQLFGTGENAAQIDVHDTRTGERISRLTGHAGPVDSVAFSSDGRMLVSASADRTVRVWDIAAEKCIALLNGHTDEVFTAAFHPEGKRLASAGRDRAIWLWDVTTGQEVARLDGHTNYVISLAFSPDGRSLVSGSGDRTVRIWDTEPPTRRHQARRESEALRSEAEHLVAALFAELHEPDRVVARLRADANQSASLRHAALRAVMRRDHQAAP